MKIRKLRADSKKNNQSMRTDNSSKRLIVIHENGEQREGKQFCSMRSELNTENRT